MKVKRFNEEFEEELEKEHITATITLDVEIERYLLDGTTLEDFILRHLYGMQDGPDTMNVVNWEINEYK